MRRRSAEIATAVLRALSIGVSVALCDPPAALAQTAALSTLTAEIPAQPLAEALAALGRQTGLHVLYVSGVVRHQRSSAVAAGLDVDAGLTRLLQGTGLGFERLTANSVRILAAEPSAAAVGGPVRPESPFEIMITATRREENLQEVPITIQAITGEGLEALGLTTFDELLKYTTNITYSGNGPGTGNIFIRGLGASGTGNQSQSTFAPFPNVALYLDDQALQFPARNADVYMFDLQRVEVLEGPQGTLFGGGAQAGAIRYITNKPQLGITAGEFNAAYGLTARGGDPNTLASAVINIPLIANTLSVRAAIFSERRGGYIDNVPSTIGFVPGTPEAATGVTANNANQVRANTNPASYGGLRLSGLYQFDDDWSLLIQQNEQDMHADGYFYTYPYDPNGKASGLVQSF